MLTSPLFQSELGFNPVVIADTYSDDNTITLHNGDSRTFLKTVSDGGVSDIDIPVLIFGIDTDGLRPKDLKIVEAKQQYLFVDE
jgi:hypothetical protein